MNDHTALSPADQVRALSPLIAGNAARWDRERLWPAPVVAALTEARLMGMTIPRAYGGRGAPLIEAVKAVEAAARDCALTARILVEANMGALGAVMAYGTEAQKRCAAELVLAGDKPAICITEPGAGSAATEMTTTARREGDGWVIDGTKHWITGGGVSRLHLIFAQVEGEDRIGGFLTIADPANDEWPEGLTVVSRERTMGLCGMPEAHLRFDGLRVADDMVLNAPNGFADLMTAYNAQRVGAAAVALGLAAGAMDRAAEYLKSRRQFGRPIAEFQGLQWMLADMDTAVSAARLLIHDAATSLDARGFPDKAKAARAKLFAAETGIKVVSDALQIFGARGYGDQEPLERMYRDVRMFAIAGGTAQILRTQIAGAKLGMKTPQTRGGYGG